MDEINFSKFLKNYIGYISPKYIELAIKYCDGMLIGSFWNKILCSISFDEEYFVNHISLFHRLEPMFNIPLEKYPKELKNWDSLKVQLNKRIKKSIQNDSWYPEDPAEIQNAVIIHTRLKYKIQCIITDEDFIAKTPLEEIPSADVVVHPMIREARLEASKVFLHLRRSPDQAPLYVNSQYSEAQKIIKRFFESGEIVEEKFDGYHDYLMRNPFS